MYLTVSYAEQVQKPFHIHILTAYLPIENKIYITINTNIALKVARNSNFIELNFTRRHPEQRKDLKLIKVDY